MTSAADEHTGRLTLEPESVGRGLATLVLTVVELLRQLMERQALRRMDEGDLSAQQIERLGATLMALEENMIDLCERCGVTLADLNIDLGPLGPLLGPAGERPQAGPAASPLRGDVPGPGGEVDSSHDLW